MTQETTLKPVCFMVMPFREKPVSNAADGAPKMLDCDALWDKAYQPAIEAAGYTAIRADFDTGTVIVKDMLERLAYAHLVLADVSLPNGNVYYEIGLRHVAHERGCILFAADWSRQLFDIEQFTAVRYPMTDGTVPDQAAEALQAQIGGAIQALKDSKTPWHEFIGDDGGASDPDSVFRKFANDLSDFQAQIRTVRLTRDEASRAQKVRDLAASLPASALDIPDVAIEMTFLIRDKLAWDDMLAFIARLPDAMRQMPLIEEQRLLGLSKSGNHEEAIASLEALNDRYGATEERLGLIGGRYKRLWAAAKTAREERGENQPDFDEEGYLDDAIDHYTRGMQLDYNAFYCSSNIAQLLLARGQDGDAERAVVIDHFVVAACERAIALGEDNPWTRPTLLGAAFRAGDVHKARALTREVGRQGAAAWKLATTLHDLDRAVARAADTKAGPELASLAERLRGLV